MENEITQALGIIDLNDTQSLTFSLLFTYKNVPMFLKRKTYDSCVLSRRRMVFRAKKRAMFDVGITEKFSNTEICRRTGLTDIMEWIEKLSQVAVVWNCNKTKRRKRVDEDKILEIIWQQEMWGFINRWIEDVSAVIGKQWIKIVTVSRAWKQLQKPILNPILE